MILETSTIISIIFVVLLIGVLANIGGFGGGIIIIPVLTLFYNIPLKTVIGTTLSAIFFPALIGVIFAAKRREINYKIAIIIEIPTIIGVTIGTSLTDSIPETQLQIIFGTTALMISFLFFRKSLNYYRTIGQSKTSDFWKRIGGVKPVVKINTEYYSYQVSIPFAIMGGLGIGIFAGLLGIGGGFFKSSIMVIGFSIPPIIASGTALFMVLITSFTGGLLHINGSNWDFSLFIILTLTLAAGSIIGDRLKTKMNSAQITLLLTAVLFVISLITLHDVIFD